MLQQHNKREAMEAANKQGGIKIKPAGQEQILIELLCDKRRHGLLKSRLTMYSPEILHVGVLLFLPCVSRCLALHFAGK